MSPLVIHWFRRDLRLTDNLALQAASKTGLPILPVFIFDPAIITSPKIGLTRLSFMLKALEVLDSSLRKKGSSLWIGYGDPKMVMAELVVRSQAVAVYTNRDYTPFAYKRDRDIERCLSIPMHIYDDTVLLAPGSVLKDNGEPYTVFTPFKKKWLTIPKLEMVQSPSNAAFVSIDNVANFHLEGRGDLPFASPFGRVPRLGELGLADTIAVPEASETEALHRLDKFLSGKVYSYESGRNELTAHSSDDTDTGTSFVSPYLRFGLLSPRQAYWGARNAYVATVKQPERESVETWVSELIWREFYMHILHHFPHVMKGSFRRQYDNLEWRYEDVDVSAWKAGMTGFPVVDAAMRQLQVMGWMPNRARMIVASFLAKDLLVDWRVGERHFMDWLVDGDPAANNGGWQWSAGTGTDAQPYFRIFNPVAQSEKFDPNGNYIRRWIPELRDVPLKFIHTPWKMTIPPKQYPRPIVDRTMARERTLEAFKAVGKVP